MGRRLGRARRQPARRGRRLWHTSLMILGLPRTWWCSFDSRGKFAQPYGSTTGMATGVEAETDHSRRVRNSVMLTIRTQLSTLQGILDHPSFLVIGLLIVHFAPIRNQNTSVRS
jgi:hypothetical protein